MGPALQGGGLAPILEEEVLGVACILGSQSQGAGLGGSLAGGGGGGGGGRGGGEGR